MSMGALFPATQHRRQVSGEWRHTDAAVETTQLRLAAANAANHSAEFGRIHQPKHQT
jgi:hypothetical protein